MLASCHDIGGARSLGRWHQLEVQPFLAIEIPLVFYRSHVSIVHHSDVDIYLITIINFGTPSRSPEFYMILMCVYTLNDQHPRLLSVPVVPILDETLILLEQLHFS